MQLWVAVAFAAFGLVFLAVVFFAKENLSQGQWKILQFFIALSGGLASGLFAGEASIKVTGELGEGLQLALQGTAGFAVFFAIWFTFDRGIFPDAFHFNVPAGWKFEQAARAMGKHDNKAVEFVGFTDAELQAALDPHEVHTKTLKQALLLLRNLVAGAAVRPYVVDQGEGLCRLRM